MRPMASIMIPDRPNVEKVRALREMDRKGGRNGDDVQNESQNLHPSRKERV